MERVLVVDDDPHILRALGTGLRGRGFEVFTAADGEAALDLLDETAVDILVLDLGLPGIDGLEVIRRLRAWSEVPIVVLSVREGQRDKVTALDAGADDYLVKPFDMQELLARMRAVGRRTQPQTAEPTLRFGSLEVDLAHEVVRLDGEPVHLTPTERRLLRAMATNPGKLLTHAWLLQQVWGPGYVDESHLLRVYVQQLRRKLGDDPARPLYITTESGLGYRWTDEVG